MAIKIIEELSKPGTTQMPVVVQGDTPEEVSSPNTRQEILRYARSTGFPASGVGNIPQAYPVDENGETTEDLMTGKKRVVGYRGDYVLQASLRA